MIHVCFGFTDTTGRYSKFIGTSMLSIFENTRTPPHSIVIHLLHDNTLTDDNREKFLTIAERYHQFVKFYNVEELCTDKLAAIRKFFPDPKKIRVTFGALYRLFIPTVLSVDIEKAIYLDADILVNLDINELWQTELGDKMLGVILARDNGTIHDKIVLKGFVKPENYFNSGVLVMNLRLLRGEENTIIDGMKFRIEHKCTKFIDQPILNWCFSLQTVKLPVKFNQYVRRARRLKESVTEKIYHYTVDTLRFNLNDPFNRLWFEYFAKTPWFDVETIAHFYDELIKDRSMLQDKILSVSAMTSGKSRAFFVEPASVDAIKEFFAIRDDELIIPAENEEAIQKLLDAMKKARGKCVFFIMTPNFLKKKFPFKSLLKARFVEDVDFVKGWELLPLEKGGVFNSHSIVKAL